jgi:hypothetical protein
MPTYTNVALIPLISLSTLPDPGCIGAYDQQHSRLPLLSASLNLDQRLKSFQARHPLIYLDTEPVRVREYGYYILT